MNKLTPEQLVTKYYSLEFDTAIEDMRKALSSEDAVFHSQNLSLREGWRERRVAAEICAAFKLKGPVDNLVQAFCRNPEMHGGLSLLDLFRRFDVDAKKNLEIMKDHCDDSPYGNSLKEKLNL
jgi:hypothetical protein